MVKEGAVSASTIGTWVITATGCHVLRVEGYSHTKLLGPGAAALSCRFKAAGQTWRISYYPNGHAFMSDRDSIALALTLIDCDDYSSEVCANAIARFTLLPHHGKQPPESALQPHSVRLSRKFDGQREVYFAFIKREQLEKSEGYLVDDCFAVRCDIHVVKTWARRDRAEDVLETTAEMGLVWRSGDEGGGSSGQKKGGGSTSTATWLRQWRAEWPFACSVVMLVCTILYYLFVRFCSKQV